MAAVIDVYQQPALARASRSCRADADQEAAAPARRIIAICRTRAVRRPRFDANERTDRTPDGARRHGSDEDIESRARFCGRRRRFPAHRRRSRRRHRPWRRRRPDFALKGENSRPHLVEQMREGAAFHDSRAHPVLQPRVRRACGDAAREIIGGSVRRFIAKENSETFDALRLAAAPIRAASSRRAVDRRTPTSR